MNFLNTNAPTQIFISYRRAGGDAPARLIYNSLTERNYNVFLDVKSLRSGTFDTALYKKIEQCKDFVLVLSENALRRCNTPKDWVRLEIEHALALTKNIIPVMMKDFVFPDKLPNSLKRLPLHNGIPMDMNFFDAAMVKLTEMLYSKPAFWTTKKFFAILGVVAIGAGAMAFMNSNFKTQAENPSVITEQSPRGSKLKNAPSPEHNPESGTPLSEHRPEDIPINAKVVPHVQDTEASSVTSNNNENESSTLNDDK